jgi:hypothetical protein
VQFSNKCAIQESERERESEKSAGEEGGKVFDETFLVSLMVSSFFRGRERLEWGKSVRKHNKNIDYDCDIETHSEKKDRRKKK